MKNLKKNLLLSILFLFALTCLTGCDDLDKLKTRHAKYEDESLQTINYQGETYHFIGTEDYLAHGLSASVDTYSTHSLNPFLSQTVHVTDSDVPLLLSPIVGGYGIAFPELGIIEHNGIFFATDEKKDTFLDTLKNTVFDHFGFISFDGQYFSATEEQVAALHEILATPECHMTKADLDHLNQVYYSDFNYDPTDPTSRANFELWIEDSNHYFCESVATIIFPKGKNSETALITFYNMVDSQYTGDYEIPASYIELFYPLIDVIDAGLETVIEEARYR